MEEHVVTGRVDKDLPMSILTDGIKALAISTYNRQNFHVNKFMVHEVVTQEPG
jgi:hypothetical protein